MIFSASLMFVCLVALPWLLVIHMKNKLKHLVLMGHGMCYINHVERALEHLPQHRGMANAFLNGDQGFQKRRHGQASFIRNCVVWHDARTEKLEGLERLAFGNLFKNPTNETGTEPRHDGFLER